ncbi:hypothetical protein PISMIDRAFT_113712, partial [Pisolithus microcarpus 441]
KKARATQAAAEKATHEAAEYTHAAREVQEEAEKCLQRGIQLVIIPMLDKIATVKTRVQYEQGCFHFAVAGVLGSGKSSLINAICGVENQNQGAAETILASEGGSCRNWGCRNHGQYSDPNPDWLYFNTQGLFVFDCVFVLFSNRFTQTDIVTLTNCMRFQIPTYIVFSKVDVHICNIMYKDGHDRDCDDVTAHKSLFPSTHGRFIADTQANVKTNLEEGVLPDQHV